MSGLSEAELHVQAMRLVCEALADREQQGIEVDWDVLRQMYDQMDAMLQELQHKHRYDSSEIVDLRKDRDHWKQARQEAIEAGELMQAEIEKLRKDFESLQWIVENIKTMAGGVSVQDADGCSLAVGQIQKYFNAAEYPLCNPQQDAAAWQQQVDSANKEVSYLRARLDEERSVSAGLRQQLDAAQAAVALQRAGIERLQAFVSMVRAARDEHNGLARDAIVEAALAELDADTEPAPVAEPIDAEGGA